MPIFSYCYSVFYILLWLLLFSLYIRQSKYAIKSKTYIKCEIIAIATIVWFIGLRGFVYSDFTNYYDFFENLPFIWSLSEFNYEPGFVVYSSLIKSIFPDYFVWIFINTIIDLYFFILVFKRYKISIPLTFLFFISYQGLVIEFNLLRNVKAIILFMYSLRFISERKFVPFIICNIIGFTFHYSAIIYFPMYYLLNVELNNRWKWIIIMISALIFIKGTNFTYWILSHVNLNDDLDMIKKALVYTINDSSYKLSFGFFERTFNICLFTILYKKLKNQVNDIHILYNCALAFYVIFMLFADVRVFVERFPTLFIFSYWIIFSLLFSTKEIRKTNKFLLMIILLFSFLRVAKENNHLLAKYENLMFGITNYDTRVIHAEKVLNSFIN